MYAKEGQLPVFKRQKKINTYDKEYKPNLNMCLNAV